MDPMLEQILFYLGALVAFGIGMGCGSYATMPYYRLPNGITSAGKWLGKKSACPKCDVQLRTRDLVPVFNRLWHRGKCFNCGAEIPWIYWWIEFLCATSALWCYLQFGFDERFLTTYGVIVCLVTLFATEITYQQLPNTLMVVAALFGAFAMSPDILFDQIHVLFTGVILCVAFAGFYHQRNGAEFGRYDMLRLTCLGAVWMPLIHFLPFILAVLVLALIIRVIQGAEARIGLAPVVLIAGYLLFLPLFS